MNKEIKEKLDTLIYHLTEVSKLIEEDKPNWSTYLDDVLGRDGHYEKLLEAGYHYRILTPKNYHPESYQLGFREGAEQMREQIHHLLKYTIHD